MVKLLAVAPGTGLVVTPDGPTYHCTAGDVPDAATVKVAVLPKLMVVETGWVVMAGGVMTVTMAAFEDAKPAALVARTQ